MTFPQRSNEYSESAAALAPYSTSSEDFYQRFRAGELGDAMDIVEWSIFHEIWAFVRPRLEMLEAASALCIHKSI